MSRHSRKPQGERAEAAGELRVNVYAVLQECVERGVAYGWHRAHKHTDSPSEDQACEEIRQAVLIELCEAFWWDSPADD